jgi:hypothetical protein
MEMYTAQVIAILVLAYLLFEIYKDYRSGRLEWGSLLSWSVIIAVFALVAVFPVRVSVEIKDLLGLGRGLDALFVVSIGLIFLLIFELYAKIDKTEREITELTRKVAIELEEINEKLKELEKGGGP